MNTVKKAAVLTAAACAMVMSGAGVASADGSGVNAAAIGSPGLLSGNIFQMPINMPINNCGNSLGLFAILNPSFGNTCANVSVRPNRYRRMHRFGMHAWCVYRGEGWRRGGEGWQRGGEGWRHHGRRHCGRRYFGGRGYWGGRDGGYFGGRRWGGDEGRWGGEGGFGREEH